MRETDSHHRRRRARHWMAGDRACYYANKFRLPGWPGRHTLLLVVQRDDAVFSENGVHDCTCGHIICFTLASGHPPITGLAWPLHVGATNRRS